VLLISRAFAKKLECKPFAKTDTLSFQKTLKKPTRRSLRRETLNSTSISDLFPNCICVYLVNKLM